MQSYFAHCMTVKNQYVKMVTPVCERHGLTYMEFTVLLFLANNPQFDTATEIVKYRQLTKSHVSISVSSLQRRGLLVGQHRDKNHRTVHLSVTDAAKSIVADGRKAQKKFIDAVFAGFSQEEAAAMKSMMIKIEKNIQEINKGAEING